MKIFIGKISSELDADTVYNHFQAFGEIEHFNFKNQFAFVEYKNDSDANKVLDKREIEIKGNYVIVEPSNSKGRPRSEFSEGPRRDEYPPISPPRDDYRAPRYDDRPPRDDYRAPRYDDRPPRYDDYRGAEPYPPRQPSMGGYDDYRGAEHYPPRHSYEPRSPSYKDDYREAPIRSSRDDCAHCSRCEIHGNPKYPPRQDNFEHKRPRREHPNDINKIVIQTIPQDVNLADVDDFVRRNEFDFVFSRLTLKRDAAIVEFRDIETRDRAIAKLDGQDLKGTTIHVREFRVSGNFQGNQNTYREKNNDNNQHDQNTWANTNQEKKDDTWANTNQENKDDTWGSNNQEKTDDAWGTTQEKTDDTWGNAKNDDNQGVDIYSGIDK